MLYFADICDLCTLKPMVTLLLYHLLPQWWMHCWIFVYVILNACLGLNQRACGFEVSAVCDMEELAHSKVLSHHPHGLLSTLQTNMQTLNRFLHLPQTNVVAAWKHRAAVSDPREREVQDAFSFDFSGHLRQAALNYTSYAVIISNLSNPEMLGAFVDRKTSSLCSFQRLQHEQTLGFLAVVMIENWSSSLVLRS